MRIFFRALFAAWGGNCDTAAMIRIFSANVQTVRRFSNCGSETGAVVFLFLGFLLQMLGDWL
jgi:hypothetical protein